MSDFRMKIDWRGNEALRSQLQTLLRDARTDKMAKWTVGTAVFYAPFHEFGTAHITPRPFFRPAVHRVARKFDAKKRYTGAYRFAPARGVQPQHLPLGRAPARPGETGAPRIWQVWFQPEGQLGKKMAAALRNEVQQVIREKSIIDTGTLHDSIAWGSSPEKMLEKSRELVAASPRGSAVTTRGL